MNVTWLGHACFALEQDGYKLVIDPYTGVAGYPPLAEEAHAVYCSHGHFDHSYTDGVTLLPAELSPFTVEEVASFHDDSQGAKRGTNTIRVFAAGGVRLCHLGDLGHQLSPEQVAAIGQCDVLLVPVGGTYTVDAQGAKAVCDTLNPRCVVPMHYHHSPYGLDTVTGVEGFLRLWPAEDVKMAKENRFTVTAALPKVLVLAYPM